MDKSVQSKAQPAAKKVKKKQGKDELDRLKQAEKKKRRLEKALATSAAIRTELELKKLRKKEEQQRLDEEGAAVAEAVALHVLVGEDSDELCDIAIPAEHGYGPRIYDRRFDFPVDVRRACLTNLDCRGDSAERMGWTPRSSQQPGFDLALAGIGRGNWAFYPGNYSVCGQFIDAGAWGITTESSPGLIAAQAISSLWIGDGGPADGAFY